MSDVPTDGAEQVWLAAAARGDTAAFAQLYVCHAPRVHRFCTRLLGPEAAIGPDDLTQDVFVTAWRRLGTFRGASDFDTWLLGIAARLTCNVRRRRREVSLAADVVASGERSGERDEVVADVRSAMATLPPAARAVLALRDLEGLSYADVAAALGCSLAGVKTRLFRARAALRAELERRGVGS